MHDSTSTRHYPEKNPAFLSDLLLAALLSIIGLICIPDNALFQSDVLYIPSIVEDLSRSVSLSGWSFSPAPYFFPDMLLYAMVYLPIGDHSIAIRIYGFIQAALVFLILIRMFSPPGRRAPIYRLLFIPVTSVLLLYQDFYALLYLPGMHCMALFITLFLFYRLRREENITSDRSWLYLALTALIIASDRIFIAYFVLPLSISILLALRLRKRNPEYAARVPSQRLAHWARVAGFGSLAGLALFAIVRAVLTLERPARIGILDSGRAMVHDLSTGFSAPLLFWIQLGGLLLYGALLLQRLLFASEKEFRGERPSILFFGRISSSNILLFLFIPIVLALLSGGYIDAYSIRYFAGSIIASNAGVLAAISNLSRRPGRPSRFTGPLITQFRAKGPHALAVLAISVVWFVRPSHSVYYYPDHVQCVDRWVQESGLSTKSVVVMADYWHAKSIYLFGQFHEFSYHADYATGQPSRTIANMNWWEGRWPPDAVWMKGLDPAVVQNALNSPVEILPCGGSELWIYHKGNSKGSR